MKGQRHLNGRGRDLKRTATSALPPIARPRMKYSSFGWKFAIGLVAIITIACFSLGYATGYCATTNMSGNMSGSSDTATLKAGVKHAAAPERFYVQVGAFINVHKASEMQNKLSDSGYMAIVFESMTPDNDILYKVRIGQFSSRENAQETSYRLSTVNDIGSFVVSVS